VRETWRWRQRASILCILLSFFPWEVHKSIFGATKSEMCREEKGRREQKEVCSKIATLLPGHPRGSSNLKSTVSRALFLCPSPHRSPHPTEIPLPFPFSHSRSTKTLFAERQWKNFLTIVTFSKRENPRGIPHVCSKRQGNREQRPIRNLRDTLTALI